MSDDICGFCNLEMTLASRKKRLDTAGHPEMHRVVSITEYST